MGTEDVLTETGRLEECQQPCGYCKSWFPTSVCDGTLAMTLTVETYQALLDRGWRRSGLWLYKPNLEETCCPPYTIRLDVHKFELDKEHKRVLKKVEAFLAGAPLHGQGQQLATAAMMPAALAEGTGKRQKFKHRGQPGSLLQTKAAVTEHPLATSLGQLMEAALQQCIQEGLLPPTTYPPVKVLQPRQKKLKDAGVSLTSPSPFAIAAAASKAAPAHACNACNVAQQLAERLAFGCRVLPETVSAQPSGGHLNFHMAERPQQHAQDQEMHSIDAVPAPAWQRCRQAAPEPCSTSQMLHGPDHERIFKSPIGTLAVPLQHRQRQQQNVLSYAAALARQPSTHSQAPALLSTVGEAATALDGMDTARMSPQSGSPASTSERVSIECERAHSPGHECCPSCAAPQLEQGCARQTCCAAAGAACSGQYSPAPTMGPCSEVRIPLVAEAAPSKESAKVHAASAAAAADTTQLQPQWLRRVPVRRALVVKLVRSGPGLLASEYPLYCKYQMAQHGDSPDQITPSAFCRFLIDSPLVPVEAGDCPPGACPPCGMGSFHQQYWLDGQLVAVGVVDILPGCLSSKYLFWDPDLAPLSLGFYSALKEIEWVGAASAHCPSLRYHYMGYYIHSCPKMVYKARFRPSDLLCPLRYVWVPYEAVQAALDACGGDFLVLSDVADPVQEPGYVAAGTPTPPDQQAASIPQAQLLATIVWWDKAIKGHFRFGDLLGAGYIPTAEVDELQRDLAQWHRLVGPVAAARMVYCMD